MPDPSPFVVWLPLIGGLFALLSVIASLRRGKRQRLVSNLPTSKTTGVFIGLVELKGTAEAEPALISYLAEVTCVYYQWSIEESWSRTVTETSTDSDGKVQTRTRTESGWNTVAHGGEMIPFYLKDDCGVIRIAPEKAKLEVTTILNATGGRSHPLYYGKGPAAAIPDSDYRRRFRETAIPLHTELYVIGQARERSDIVAAEIAYDSSAPMFLISTRTEAQVNSGLRWGFWAWGIFGLLLCVGSFIGRDAALKLEPGTRWPLYFLAGAGYLAVWALGWVWMVYNSLIDLRQRVRQAWSQVEVQLKRRQDLIPNLMQIVREFRDYEQTLQTEFAELRSQLAATPPGVAGPDYRSCTKTVLAVAERYPQLQAQESFANLQKNLVETEQRIALARGYFNEIATFYNTRLEVVPDRFVAALGGLRPQALMAANDFERAPVEVNLTSVPATT